jgi:hypothetical protein
VAFGAELAGAFLDGAVVELGQRFWRTRGSVASVSSSSSW